MLESEWDGYKIPSRSLQARKSMHYGNQLCRELLRNFQSMLLVIGPAAEVQQTADALLEKANWQRSEVIHQAHVSTLPAASSDRRTKWRVHFAWRFPQHGLADQRSRGLAGILLGE